MDNEGIDIFMGKHTLTKDEEKMQKAQNKKTVDNENVKPRKKKKHIVLIVQIQCSLLSIRF